MNHDFNVLHLDAHGLRWARFNRERGRLRLAGQGQFAGGALPSLNQWLGASEASDTPIYFYDSRPLVFSFRVDLPRQARRRIPQIIPLRIKQELGLAEDAIHWTSRLEPASERGQIRLRVFVVRRAALDEIVHWRAEHGLDRMWVGCDLAAITVLEEQRASRAPLVIANAGDELTTYYYADGQGRIFKASSAGRPPEMGWGSGTTRALFGREATLDTLRKSPSISVLQTAPVEGWLSRFENGARTEGALNDPVIIGGALVALKGAPEMASLIADEGAPPIELSLPEIISRRFSTRRIATSLAIAAVLFVISIWTINRMRHSAADRLEQRVAMLAPKAQIDQSHMAVLTRIRQSKIELMPVLIDLIEAAPNGVTLQRINITESGQLQIDGTVQDAKLPDAFRTKLSESKHLQDVRLPETQTNQRQGGNTFKMTAQINKRRK